MTEKNPRPTRLEDLSPPAAELSEEEAASASGGRRTLSGLVQRSSTEDGIVVIAEIVGLDP